MVGSDADCASPAEGFAVFYAIEHPNAVRLAWLLTRGSPDADDIAQDSLLKVRSRFATLDNPAAYLRVIVVNACRDRSRRRRRELAHLRTVVQRDMSLDRADVELLSVVAQLSDDHRTAVILRYWSDLSDAAIAEIVGVSETTVRTRIHRALRVMRKELER